MFRCLRRWLVVVPVVVALSLPLIAAKKPVTIDALIDAPSNRHGPVFWAPDGARFIVSERGLLSLYDVRSGKSRDIVSLDRLEKAAVKPLEPALYDWTNRRVDETDVQWFADNKRILVAASGDPLPPTRVWETVFSFHRQRGPCIPNPFQRLDLVGFAWIPPPLDLS